MLRDYFDYFVGWQERGGTWVAEFVLYTGEDSLFLWILMV